MWSTLLLSLLLGVTYGSLDKIYQKEKEILDLIVGRERYDPNIAPYNQTALDLTPTIVRFNIHIQDISQVCSADMKWKTQINLRNHWNDPRLTFENLRGQINFLVLRDEERIWRPDPFFSNSWSTKRLGDLQPNTVIRIYPNGNVLYSTLMDLILWCPMDFNFYPFDRQICSLTLASYAYTTDELVFLWKESYPIQLTKTLLLTEFALLKYATNNCTSRTNTGEYSCLKVDFLFERDSNKYICQWFFPTSVLTLLSFASFWIKPKSTRIKFLSITLFLLYLQTLYINSQTPIKVSYNTSKDRWLMTCVMFVLATIGEMAIVSLVDKVIHTKNSVPDLNEPNAKITEDELTGSNMMSLVNNGKAKMVGKWKNSSAVQRIDVLFGCFFPLLFFILVALFCSTNIIRGTLD